MNRNPLLTAAALTAFLLSPLLQAARPPKDGPGGAPNRTSVFPDSPDSDAPAADAPSPRDLPGRDLPARELPPRNIPTRDLAPRDGSGRDGRDRPARDKAAKPDKPAYDGDELAVAILDFESTAPGNAELGKQVSEAITAQLSGQDGFTLVDRATMRSLLAEHELNLTGLVNADDATKIGKLVGARILVTGKVFALDKSLFFTAKLIGTETSLVDGVMVKSDKDVDMGDQMMKLAARVAARLRDAGPRLAARNAMPVDPIPGLKRNLAGRRLPAVSVEIRETHNPSAAATHIDPAAQTEVRMVLKDAGFKIVSGDERDLADGGVRLLITGEGISEFGARIGNLVNCVGRVEIEVKDRKTGEVVFSDRETARAVDLAESIASKTALQKAGHAVSIRLLRYIDSVAPRARAVAADDGQIEPR